MKVKVFKFCLKDVGSNYKKERNSPLKEQSASDIEVTLNTACIGLDIVNITVNTYTTHRHNNCDCDEVYALYTIVYK
jgi:hypothetical protein